jgi:hypothetical protein
VDNQRTLSAYSQLKRVGGGLRWSGNFPAKQAGICYITKYITIQEFTFPGLEAHKLDFIQKYFHVGLK